MTRNWTEEEVGKLSEKFGIQPNCVLHSDAEDYHFPRRSFLQDGYAPPGGYVKDFTVLWHEGRLHLIHIDGRPGEVCWVTGNEISFGHASTSDFCHWIRHPMPLAVGDRPWESEHVWAPYVYRWNDLFYLFYMGNGKGRTFVSYATSRNLETWIRWENGPIAAAVGRDPFAFAYGTETILLYTAHGGAKVSACISVDMVSWQPIQDVLTIAGGMAAESPSLHKLRDRFVLWFNDYGEGLKGFRAAYALSDNPLHFEEKSIREFNFKTEDTEVVPSPELKVDKPIPLSIELIKAGERRWLVSYFRWKKNRNRLFFGEIDWRTDPATLQEITKPEQFEAADFSD